MSEKESKVLDTQAKVAVLTPFIVLLTLLLFLGSCANSKCIYKKDYKKSNESRYSCR